MWWTNHTSQIKKKKKDSWDPPQNFWFNPGSEAGVPYSAFLISKWGFHFENHGSVPEICGKTILTKQRQLLRRAETWAFAVFQQWQFK